MINHTICTVNQLTVYKDKMHTELSTLLPALHFRSISRPLIKLYEKTLHEKMSEYYRGDFTTTLERRTIHGLVRWVAVFEVHSDEEKLLFDLSMQ